MNNLADDLLSAILEHAGVSEGPAVTLVCKRWLRLFYASPGLWREFAIVVPHSPPLPVLPRADRDAALAQWVAARAALLERVAGMVETLRVRDCKLLDSLAGGGQLARFLRCLEPEAARRVGVFPAGAPDISEGAMAALAPLTGLTALNLCCGELPDNAAAVLHQLSASLQDLTLSTDDVWPELAETFPLLGQLTSLQLWTWGPLANIRRSKDEPAFDWCLLTALSRLRRLTLSQTYADDAAQLQPPPPAAFAALADFDFFADAWTLQLAGAEMRKASYELMAWQPEDGDDELLDEYGEPEPRRPNEPAHSLSLEDVERLGSLRALLDALLSPRTPLRRLSIETNVHLTPAAVLHCGQHLAGLTALHLTSRAPPADNLAAALQALLEQAPRVTQLTAHVGPVGGPLPAFLAQRPWQHLSLGATGLTELPTQGAYLSDLESLSLTGRDLPRLPAALTAATALTSLSLPGFTATRLATAAEWDACLPQSLRSLALRHCGLTDLPPFRQLAALTLLDLQQNAFTQPPPALAAATALVHLDLLCDGLRLNAEQVDGLRKHKPALRRLRCGMLPGVYRHLRATAPELTISSNSTTW